MSTFEPTIALVPYGDVIERWLQPLGLDLDGFCRDMTGGWMFGYIDALGAAGIRTVLFCCSTSVAAPTRLTHEPTGAVVWAYPAARRFSVTRRRYAPMRPASPWHPRRIARSALWHVSPYLGLRARALAEVLRREGCGALMCQDYESASFDIVTALAKLLGIPSFASYQGGNVQESVLERPIRPCTLRAAAGLVIPARSELDRVRARYGVPCEKLAQIFNPLEVDEWAPMERREARAACDLPPHAEIVVSHGRIDIDDKGLDILLEAWSDVCRGREDRDLMLLLIGSGEDGPVLHGLLRSGRWKGVVWRDEFVTDRRRLRRLLCAADVFAFAGRYEGFPVAPLEAMACGLPVAATAASGVPDILGGPQSGGIVVAPGDAHALAGAIGAFLDAPELRAVTGRRGRRWVLGNCAHDVVGRQLADFLVRRGLGTDAPTAA